MNRFNRKRGRSLRAKLKSIPEQTGNEPEKLTVEEFMEKAALLRESFGDKILSDSAELIRKDREG